MSSVLPLASDASPAASSPDRPVRRRTLPAWSREPLLHFVLLGALLFAVDHAVVSRQDDPSTIVVAREVDDEARQLFKASRGREPEAAELAALRQRWIDNEVLYREGLSLRVNEGDTAIRERVIFKALSVVDAGVKLPPFDDKLLRDWFEKNRSRYDEPQRFDFQEAVLSGDSSESAVRAFAAALNAGTPGDSKAGLRVFKNRPRDNLVQSYGAAFASALEQARPGDWSAQPTNAGFRAIRLDATTPARPASFDNLRGVVLQDWTDATLAEQRSAAVKALAKKYKLRIEGASK